MEEENVSRFTSATLYEPRYGDPIGMVIHGSGGLNSLRWLQRYEPDPKKKSSADYLIRKDGKRFRLTPYLMMSYGSGRAAWNGRTDEKQSLNRTHFQVEIEMPNNGMDGPTFAQYQSIGILWVRCALAFQWNPQDTCTHAECALPPGRKIDPAPWSWRKFEDQCNLAFAVQGYPERQVKFRA